MFGVNVQVRRWLFACRLTPDPAHGRDAGCLWELLPVGDADAAVLFPIADQDPHTENATAG